jgi:hypothetical protein
MPFVFHTRLSSCSLPIPLPSTSDTPLLRLPLFLLCFLHRLLEVLLIDVQQHPCDEEQRAYDEEQDAGDGDVDCFGLEVGHGGGGLEWCWMREMGFVVVRL